MLDVWWSALLFGIIFMQFTNGFGQRSDRAWSFPSPFVCPANIQITRQGTDYVTVEWNPGSFQQFAVLYKLVHNVKTWSLLKPYIKGTTATISDLKDMTTYDIAVLPFSEHKAIPAPCENATTIQVRIGPPECPSDLQVTRKSSNLITLKWHIVKTASYGGSINVHYQPVINNIPKTLTVKASETGATLINLSENTNYTIEFSTTRGSFSQRCNKTIHTKTEHSLTFALESRNPSVNIWVPVSAADKEDNVRLTCTSEDESAPSIRRLDEEAADSMGIALSGSTATLNFTNIQCDQMGTYLCEDNLGVRRTIDMGIDNCEPRPCTPADQQITILAGVKETQTASVCIIAFPNISNEALLDNKAITAEKPQDDDKWQWRYEKKTFNTYIVHLIKRDIDYGDYGVHNLVLSTLQREKRKLDYTFNLIIGDQPDCPDAFQAFDIGVDHIMLSWKPGRDGGSTQRFYVFYKTQGGPWMQFGESIYDVTVKVTGLKANVDYIFKIVPQNDFYYAKDLCEDKILHVRRATPPTTVESPTSTTSAQAHSSRPDDPYTANVIIPVVSVIAVLIILALTVFAVLSFKTCKLFKDVWSLVATDIPQEQNTVRGGPTTENESRVNAASISHANYDGSSHISAPELIYVTVDHGSNQGKRKPRRAKRESERVEYSTVDFEKSRSNERL